MYRFKQFSCEIFNYEAKIFCAGPLWLSVSFLFHSVVCFFFILSLLPLPLSLFSSSPPTPSDHTSVPIIHSKCVFHSLVPFILCDCHSHSVIQANEKKKYRENVIYALPTWWFRLQLELMKFQQAKCTYMYTFSENGKLVELISGKLKIHFDSRTVWRWRLEVWSEATSYITWRLLNSCDTHKHTRACIRPRQKLYCLRHTR